MMLERGQRAVLIAAALSLYAALMHLLAAPDHLEEWWGYGAFMLAAAFAQGTFAPMLLGASGKTYFRPVVLAGIAGNAAIVALYVYTRTVGIPLGPGAGKVEPVGDMGWIDVTATLAEMALVLVLWRARGPSPDTVPPATDAGEASR